jgi:hypothetical protein
MSMTIEVTWHNHIKMYTVVNKQNKIIMITSDFKSIKQYLNFLDTSKIPDIVYV